MKPNDQPEFDENAPAIEEELSHLSAAVPESEWAKLPADLTDRLDHYLYDVLDARENA